MRLRRSKATSKSLFVLGLWAVLAGAGHEGFPAVEPGSPSVLAAEPPPAPEHLQYDIHRDSPPQPVVKKLDEARFSIGPITVDRGKGVLEVPGTLIRLEPPLEFLAVRKHGYKAYESLLELDSNAVELNAACILLGLDATNATAPGYQADAKPLEGDRVQVLVSWERDGKQVEVAAEELLAVDGKATGPAEWVYTGSGFTADNWYLAELDGTLIGVIHDPASIIEHRTGLGLDHYGAVAGNREVAPPVGTRITMRVMRLKDR